jgi:hypothetical protein
MSDPFIIPDTEDAAVPVVGISEWMCYHANYDTRGGDEPEAIDRCVEAHLERGIDRLVWNCGRSVVDYWSDLPNATQMCADGTMVGGQDWSFVREVMDRICPLSRAIELCRRRRVPVLGRLCMNRHYGGAKSVGVTSRFARQHRDFHERRPGGEPVHHKLCYAIEEVQQERLDILLEIQRIGVGGLVLDFCRQMPILLYHPALVEPYMEETGEDPRRIDSGKPKDWERWFRWRADVLTGFMERLREEVRRQEEDLGRDCPIIARVPDASGWLSVGFGLDVERWCEEDLVDGLMLSPFPICVDDPERHPDYHAGVARRTGTCCIGGLGTRKLIRNGVPRNDGFYHPQPVYALAEHQYRAGVDAMSIYQSETLVRMDYLSGLLREIGDPAIVRRRARTMPVPDFPEGYPIGLDWHAKPRYSLGGRERGTEML